MNFRRASNWITAVFFLAYAWFIFINNRWDWDHFYSAFLTDRNAWLTEFKPPLWSYHLCGGMSRIADPQAFGLSPSFVLFLLFGPILGAKLYLLILFFVAHFFLLKIVSLFFEDNHHLQSNVGHFIATSFSLQLITSGYFLWQVIAGHFTQMMMPWIIALYYFHLLRLKRPLKLREYFSIIFIGWIYYSSGIYHSLIYLGVPLFFGLYTTLIFQTLTNFRHLKRILRQFFAHGLIDILSIMPGLYKIIPVYIYQQTHARGGGEFWDTQGLAVKIKNFFFLQFIPTKGPALIAFNELASLHYTIWDIGSFSPLGWGLGCTILISIWMNLKHSSSPEVKHSDFDKRTIQLFLITFIISVLFILGNYSKKSPYSLFNYYILQNSAHVTERFHICTTLLFGLIAIWLLAKMQKINKLVWISIYASSLIISFINLNWAIDAYPSEKPYSDILVPSPSSSSFQMRNVAIHKEIAWPPMYQHLNQGLSFLNCYNPLIREQVMQKVMKRTTEELSSDPRADAIRILPLIEPTEGNPSRECISYSYFTSSTLHISKHCYPGVCINLLWVPESDPNFSRLVQRNDRLCLK